MPPELSQTRNALRREKGCYLFALIRNPAGKRNRRCLKPRSTRTASSSAFQCHRVQEQVSQNGNAILHDLEGHADGDDAEDDDNGDDDDPEDDDK